MEYEEEKQYRYTPEVEEEQEILIKIENEIIDNSYEVPILTIYERIILNIPESIIKDNTLIEDLYNYLLISINKSILDYFKI